MRAYHRHSLFPMVIIVLSLLLAGFMFLTFRARPAPVSNQEPEVEVVDVQAYERAMRTALQTFDERYAAGTDDAARLLATQTALSDVLALRVPVQHKDVHLSLALALTQLHNVLEGGEGSQQAPREAIRAIVASQAWLSL